METFAKRIKNLRNEKEITQRELAKNANLSSASIGFYERNERKPTGENIIKLCEYFGVSADYLLGLSDNKKTADEIIKDFTNNKPEINKALEQIILYFKKDKNGESLQKITDIIKILTN